LERRGDCSDSTASTTIDGTLSNWWTKIVTGIPLFAFIALRPVTIAIARRGDQQGGSKVMISLSARGAYL
jgi:hypothetical protein